MTKSFLCEINLNQNGHFMSILNAILKLRHCYKLWGMLKQPVLILTVLLLSVFQNRPWLVWRYLHISLNRHFVTQMDINSDIYSKGVTVIQSRQQMHRNWGLLQGYLMVTTGFLERQYKNMIWHDRFWGPFMITSGFLNCCYFIGLTRLVQGTWYFFVSSPTFTFSTGEDTFTAHI